MEDNLKVISDVDRAFNERDWDAFTHRHADNVIAFSPLTPEPTKGVEPHREAMQGLFRAFPDMTMKQELSFGQGDWVCAVYSLEGTQDGPFRGPGGKEIPPTNKPVKMSFCAAMKVENKEIVEERVYFDVLGMMAQLGISP